MHVCTCFRAVLQENCSWILLKKENLPFHFLAGCLLGHRVRSPVSVLAWTLGEHSQKLSGDGQRAAAGPVLTLEEVARR